MAQRKAFCGFADGNQIGWNPCGIPKGASPLAAGGIPPKLHIVLTTRNHN